MAISPMMVVIRAIGMRSSSLASLISSRWRVSSSMTVFFFFQMACSFFSP